MIVYLYILTKDKNISSKEPVHILQRYKIILHFMIISANGTKTRAEGGENRKKYIEINTVVVVMEDQLGWQHI